MKKTYITFDSIKEDKELGLMVGAYCKSNQQFMDAVVSLLNVSIKGQRVVTFDRDEDNIIWIGFGEENSGLLKHILFDKPFIIYHEGREFIRMEEHEE